MNNFNDKQLEAITAPLGQTLVIAGAGSGKTSVLTNRIVHLIQNFQIYPSQILAITFTNKAANEMKERLSKMVKDNFRWIGTFHSICLRILREDINVLNRDNNFAILDEEDQNNIVKEFIRKYNIDTKEYPLQVCINHIAKFKSERIDIEALLDEKNWKYFNFKNLKQAVTNQRIIKYYLKYCDDNNLLDFNDLLSMAIKVLSFDNVKEKWQERIKYILIDEFQDTNDIQYELIKILSGKYQNIFAVGDPDQMIYSWRGANENITKEFCRDFANTKIIILNQNYRSTQEILDAANNLILNNKNRIHKDLITSKKGEKPIFYLADSQDNESLWVANKINELLQTGYRLKDIAILYRSNYLSRSLEEVFFSNNIYYVLYGGVKFYNRKEIKDMIAYLRAIYFHEDLFIKRIINTPRRGISSTTVDIINDYAIQNNITFYQALLKCDETNLNSAAKNAIRNFIETLNACYSESIIEAFDNVLEVGGYKELLVNNEQVDRLPNIDELRNAISQYLTQNPNSNFIDYLQEVALYTSGEEDKNEDAVHLMTIHIAKGLEYKCVFIVGLNENVFPSKKSLDSGYKGIEEERRIAYVAITRAKEKLFLSAYMGFNPITHECHKKSRFVDEISELFYTPAKTTFKRINKTNSDDTWFDSKKPFDASKQYSEQKVTFKIGDKISHELYGVGIVIGVRDEYIDVSFNKPHGNKTLISNHISIKRIIG